MYTQYCHLIYVHKSPLVAHDTQLFLSFHQDICKPTSCLYHLIPPPRNTSVITRLRPTTLLPKPSLRTKNYCSFINFGLHHYQPKSNSQPFHSAHPFHCTYVVYVVCFDCYYCFYVLFHLHFICYSALAPQVCY